MNIFSKKHKGFSVAEATIALLIGSIALGMAAPMITKQIKQNNFNDTQFQVVNRQIEQIREVVNNNNELDELREEIEDLREEVTNANTISSGMVAFFATTSCPNGWHAINENWQGRFPRFAGTHLIKSYNKISKEYNTTGTTVTLGVGTTQEDTIRNITGSGPAFITYGDNYYVNWIHLTTDAFYKESSSKNETAGAGNLGNSRKTNILKFAANRSVPTSAENRPKAVALLGCQKD